MKKKQLKCPVCGRRLIDEVEGHRSKLRAEGEIEDNWIPNYFQKCLGCKNQIGIKTFNT